MKTYPPKKRTTLDTSTTTTTTAAVAEAEAVEAVVNHVVEQEDVRARVDGRERSGRGGGKRWECDKRGHEGYETGRS